MAIAVLVVALPAACGGEPGAPVRVPVPRGSSFRAAADSLASRGVIGSPTLFRLYARFKDGDRQVRAGTYQLRRGSDWDDVLASLAEGRNQVGTITIPEGFALADIVPRLARAIGAPPESVWAAARDTALRRRLDVPTPTLEGYLFPNTYTFVDGTTARAAVVEMVGEFERHWQPGWDARLQELAMSRHDVVTLAAIVEKEVRRGEERPVVSAVYHNRLRTGMRLQADPTVQYALGRHVTRVLYRDLEVDSPYNTYRRAGLPPGPIASPGAASIEAALYPAKVPYLFFVAHPDGHHEFRTTFREHAEAIQMLQRARDTARGAARPARR